MMTTRPPQPAVMQIIEQRRKRLGLSYRRAAALAGISETRWRQLEAGGRIMNGVPVAEEAGDHTLAHMALAVRMMPADLRDAGREAAAEIMADIAAGRTAQDAQDTEDAARMVDALGRDMNARQRAALEAEVASALRASRKKTG